MKIKPGFWKKISITFLFLILLGVSFSAGTLVSSNSSGKINFGEKISYDTASSSTEPLDFNLYWQVWNTLKQNYVDKDKMTDKEFFYGSLKGMVSSINDPYTVFMDPQASREFKSDLAGTFEGIGAEVGLRDDVVTIIAPLTGLPAEKAGLKAGDKIYKINGETTNNMTVDQAVKKIRGPKNTIVTLSIFRKGFTDVKDYKITRDVIVIKSVKTEMRTDKVYVITVTAFNNDTLDLFNKAIKDIQAKKPKGIVLDLRNNPGGYLDTAIAMSSEWVVDGPVVLEKSSNGEIEKYYSNGQGRLAGYPTVILINKGSASASEIVTGALKDYKKATVIGEKSYGKGSVQNLISLPDGSSLKVTIAKWLTPKGQSINEQGITPDETIAITDADVKASKDPQFKRAIDILINNKKTAISKKK